MCPSGQALTYLGFFFDLLEEQKLTDKSSFSTLYIFNEHLKEMKNWHFDWTHSLTVPVTQSIALKASYGTP